MKVRVECDALADAVQWTAKTLPKGPAGRGGLLLDADSEHIKISSFDLDLSSEASLGSQVEEPGRALVSGRLLADIARNLPAAPVSLETDGGRCELRCGRARFMLPMLPEDDYPPLPSLPPEAGALPGSDFAQAVAQTYIAASKADTLPHFTGIRLEAEEDTLTLAATDRYRLAVRELNWSPAVVGFSRAINVPGRALSDVAKSFGATSTVQLALEPDEHGERTLGIVGDDRRFTTRLLDPQFPKFRDLLPEQFASSVRADVAELSEAIKRVALVAERNMPVRLDIRDGEIELRVGNPDETQAQESVEAQLEGSPMVIAFNPTYLLDGLHALGTPTAVIRYNESVRPAVIVGAGEDAEPSLDFRYLLMPVKI